MNVSAETRKENTQWAWVLARGKQKTIIQIVQDQFVYNQLINTIAFDLFLKREK